MASSSNSKSNSTRNSSISASYRSSGSKRKSRPSQSSLDKNSGPTLVHVEKLSKDVNEAHLKEIFSHYGTVLKAYYLKNNRKYTIRRFGFVEFENKAVAKKAILYLNGA